MKSLISLWFIPQENNNFKAKLLQPGIISIFIALYLLNQSLVKSLTIIKPGVLGYSSEITVDKVFNQTNAERAKAGLPILKYNSTLSISATQKAQDMFANGYWAHNSPSGKSPWDFFKEAGYRYSIAGENLAKDFYDTDSMLKAWMKSPTHKANILQPKYQEIGIGVANGILNGVKTTLVVQHFAAPQSSKVMEINPSEIALNPITVPPPALLQSTDVLSGNANPKPLLINPLEISKTLGALMFVIIIGVLLLDGYFTLKKGTKRLSGSAAGQVSFLAIIFLLLLFTRQGSVF